MAIIKKNPLLELGMHAGVNAIIFNNARKLRERLTPVEEIIWQFLKSKPLGQK